MSRDDALTRRYLEHSPKALLSMLVVDVDHDDALLRALHRPMTHPEPSWVAESPNGRGHVGWVLRTPVCRTDAGRLKPFTFAAKVEAGLRRSLDGDVGYTGLLTKNPLHPDWHPHWGRAEPWELRDLAAGLGELMPRSLPRKVADSSGLGRNVALFNDLRLWAYRARLQFTVQQQWEAAVDARALERNGDFPLPLPAAEVLRTAESVARWVWRRFSVEGFSAVQAARGRRNTSEQQAAKRRRLDPAAAMHFIEEQEAAQ